MAQKQGRPRKVARFTTLVRMLEIQAPSQRERRTRGWLTICTIVINYKSVLAGVWPSGKATDFESVYRGFESLHPSLVINCPRRNDWRRRMVQGLPHGRGRDSPIFVRPKVCLDAGPLARGVLLSKGKRDSTRGR